MTKKVAAPVSSVGADGEQPDTKKSTKIITNPQKQINLQAAERWHVSLCRCAKGGEIVLYGAASLSCGNGDSIMGISCPQGNGAVSGIRG